LRQENPKLAVFLGAEMSDDIRCECGVFGIFGAKNAAQMTYFGLYALQHRGQEGAGIVTFDGKEQHEVRGQGEVAEVFNRQERLTELKGDRAIGHNRYSTAGSSTLRNVQPLVITFKGENRSRVSWNSRAPSFRLHQIRKYRYT
jgi:amidophosphoribosyltransferase